MNKLTDTDVAKLLAAGKVTSNERVLLEGDIVIAVDVVTGTRRVVDTTGLIIEGTRRLLCD